MGARPVERRRAFGKWTTAIAFLLFLLLVWTIQQRAGAPQAAFGEFPDEPAHFVGGLVTHDYFATALGKNPVEFVKNYHLYLPYFALGVWPPFFYAIEGAWMQIFGVQRDSVLWLVALAAASLAALLFSRLRKEFDFWTALAGGGIFLLVPIVQWSACLVMADLTCSLFAFIAIVFFARFLERGRWQDSLYFGVFFGIALLTKNSTYYVALVPPLVIAGTRRWDVLRSRALWIAPAVAALIYLPWLLLSRSVLLLGIHGLELPGFFGTQRIYLTALWHEMTVLTALAPMAVAALFVPGRAWKMTPFGACMLAVIPAVSMGIFLARVPVQNRLMVVSYIAVIYLAAQFWRAAAGSRAGSVMMICTVAAFAYLNWLQFRRPPANYLHDSVKFIQAREGSQPGSVLVPSAAEGPWIAEFAQSESRRPLRIFLRPTKVLGEEDWNGTNWKPYYTTTEDLLDFFRKVPVKYCILSPSSTGRRYPHDQLLLSIVSSQPQWRLIREGPGGDGATIRIYENSTWTPAADSLALAELKRLAPELR